MPEPSLAQMYRDFGDRWEIEPVPPGTRWLAVDRESGGELVRVVLAHEVGTLRYRLKQAQQEEPEERDPNALRRRPSGQPDMP